MDLKKLKLSIEQSQKVCNEMNKCANKFILQDSINMINEAITVTHCCKSDSEQLVLFADWLQYNGKWSTTKQQVKDFLKEQEGQN